MKSGVRIRGSPLSFRLSAVYLDDAFCFLLRNLNLSCVPSAFRGTCGCHAASRAGQAVPQDTSPTPPLHGCQGPVRPQCETLAGDTACGWKAPPCYATMVSFENKLSDAGHRWQLVLGSDPMGPAGAFTGFRSNRRGRPGGCAAHSHGSKVPSGCLRGLVLRT